jgi:protoporphyrin/coproporphyrin ferrochelatase
LRLRVCFEILGENTDMTFQPEPKFTHGKPPANNATTAVLLCNLGTPDAPTAAALRTYLKQFLSDPRVVEIPRLVWWFILNCIIVPFRSTKSAKKYASIWTADGSPLKIWTEKQANLLQGWLGEAGHRVTVRYAMCYTTDEVCPSIKTQLDKFKEEGISRVLILPAYPQYSSTTTAAVFDQVYDWAAKVRSIPELRFVNRYHDDAGYITALEKSVRKKWQINGKPNFDQIGNKSDMLVMSFHGIPERSLHLGDAYHCECYKTARLLAEALELQPTQYKVTFQSRLGRAKWLQPYTEPTVIAMAKSGVKRIDVICPGFNCDGLETLEEINMEVRHAFTVAGGQTFNYIPCLNDDSAWLSALSSITQKHLSGWPTQRNTVEDAAALKTMRDEALKAGAKD